MNLQEIIVETEQMNYRISEVSAKLRSLDTTLIQIDEITSKLASLKEQINNIFKKEEVVVDQSPLLLDRESKNMWPQLRPEGKTFKILEVTGRKKYPVGSRAFSIEYVKEALDHKLMLWSGCLWISEAEVVGDAVFTYRRKKVNVKGDIIQQFKSHQF